MAGWRNVCGWCLTMAAAMCVVARPVRAQADAATAGGSAQTAAAKPAFDVVSVKAISPDVPVEFQGLMFQTDRMRSSGPMSLMIRQAYNEPSRLLTTEDSIVGLPGWAKTQRYDIEAKLTGEQAAALESLPKEEQGKQRQLLEQSLLENRFKVKVHFETKQAQVYELVVAKGGSKLKEGDASTSGMTGPNGKPLEGSFLRMMGRGKVGAQAFGIGALANFLSQGPTGLGRRVIDKTGLTGKYNFTLSWSTDPGMSSGSVDGLKVAPGQEDSNAPSIFTALEEQLGLKLQPATATVDVLVVDHIEQPTAD